MKRYLYTLVLACSISTHAATSLQIPILLEQDGRIKEVREMKEVLKKASVSLPESVELNLLRLPTEVLPDILNNIDRLSRKSGSRITLVTDASIGTYTSARLKQQLCYKGEAQMALRLLPHIGEYFFSYNTVWIGYRLRAQDGFQDFDGQMIDVAKILDATQTQKLLQDGSPKDLQILTKVSSGDSKVRLDSIAPCP